MAIDAKLLSIIPASELPDAVPTSAGQFFFFEGNKMKKSPMTEIYSLVSDTKSIGTITPSTIIPSDGKVWAFAAPGNYPNAGNLTVYPNTIGILIRVDSTWSKVEVAMPNLNIINNTFTVTPEQIVPSEALYNNETLAGDILKRVDLATGENVNYREVSNWYDGTTMTDIKADGFVYKKIGNKYYELIYDFLKPEYFGAKADGNTDDTNAILACVEMASKLNKSIVFLDKTYFCSFLDFTGKSNISIHSNNGEIKQISENANGFMKFKDASNISIKGLKITGKSVGDVTMGNGYQYMGITVNNVDSFTLEDCKITHFSGGGVLCIESKNVNYRNNYLNNNAGLFDLSFGFGHPTKSLDNFITEGNECLSNNRFGIHVQGYGKNISLLKNRCENKKTYGILVYRLDDTGTNFWEELFVNENRIKNIGDYDNETYFAGMGIYIQNGKKGSANGNIIIDVLKNRSKTNEGGDYNRTLAAGALSISASTEFVVNGNYIENSGIDGIDITASAQPLINGKGVVVSNNVIKDCAEIGIFGIEIKDTNIYGNMITGKPNANTGIAIFSASNISKNVLISANTIKGNFQYGIIAIENTGTKVEDVQILSNKIEDCSKFGIQISTGEGCKISDNKIAQINVSQSDGYMGIMVGGNRCKVSNNFLINKGSNSFYRSVNVTGNNNVIDNNYSDGGRDYLNDYLIQGTANNSYLNFTPNAMTPKFNEQTFSVL